MKIKDLLENKNITEDKNKLAIGQVLNMSNPEISINKEKEITKDEYKKYKKVVKKLQKGLPIQYITKEAYFYNDKYYVNKDVLIPRLETETLVDDINKLIKNKFKNQNLNVLDIGTGSGIIAITLNKLNKNLNITATDISKKALKIAEKNQKIHNTNVKFIKTNLYQDINNKFDIIISNPPYIEEKSQQIEKEVLKNEPKIALFGGKDGLKYYREILKNIKAILKENHIIAFEIGENQGKKIEKIVKEILPKDEIIIKKDYNNFDRYIYIISKDN